MTATAMQPVSLKSLALGVLERNRSCNRRATAKQMACNSGPQFEGEKLHEVACIPEPKNRGEAADAVREHLEERAAIMEYQGGLPRREAEAEAKQNLRIYEYRLSDNGPDGPWLVMIAPGCDLVEAKRSLNATFGPTRVLAVRKYKAKYAEACGNPVHHKNET